MTPSSVVIIWINPWEEGPTALLTLKFILFSRAFDWLDSLFFLDVHEDAHYCI